ncbi:hypothetical protein SAMN05421753_104174 [Planctomicrobium piriforme]|uniref:Uncharacterized protein n=1 Tax=Planctomicrobium piriforme TaxID=1576369 RepID=A0A1I3EDC0_9PLAN|nr:hypothetical protein SAMN05421753_104174 [Planctomicrobium piriforme]
MAAKPGSKTAPAKSGTKSQASKTKAKAPEKKK